MTGLVTDMEIIIVATSVIYDSLLFSFSIFFIDNYSFLIVFLLKKILENMFIYKIIIFNVYIHYYVWFKNYKKKKIIKIEI